MSYSAVIFDLDGVIYLGNTVVPGAVELVNSLKAAGIEVRFLTNNASQHRSVFARKLQNFGMQVELEEVFNAGFATGLFIKEKFGPSKVHVMGTSELAREMVDAGHSVQGEPDFCADIAIVGLDREFSWIKLDAALQVMRRPNTTFIACNMDPCFPDDTGIRPGAGSLVAALACAAGRQPDYIVGKPSNSIMQLLKASIKDSSRCLMVGDRVETDLVGGREVGMELAFVLSGVGRVEDLDKWGISPNFVVPSVKELIDELLK